MAWPKTITTLVPEDICKGAWSRGDKRCLEGWLNAIRPDFKNSKEGKVFEGMLMNNLERLSPRAYRLDSIPDYNDHGRMNRNVLAHAWNQTLRDLDYDA